MNERRTGAESPRNAPYRRFFRTDGGVAAAWHLRADAPVLRGLLYAEWSSIEGAWRLSLARSAAVPIGAARFPCVFEEQDASRAGAHAKRWMIRSGGQRFLPAVMSRYSHSMIVVTEPLSWRLARPARLRSRAAVRCGSSAMPR